jgi:plasmid stabilization system protein ParE
LRALEAGGVKGADLVPESRYKRAIARRHVVVFVERGDKLEVVRIVHGSQDLEALAADLDAQE